MDSTFYKQIKFLYQTLKLSPKQISAKLSVPINTVYKIISKVKRDSYGKTSETLIYKTSKYKEWRALVLARDNHKCLNCGFSGNKDNPLQVDHIKPRSLYPELALTVSNGRTLCLRCHRKTNTFGRKNIIIYSKQR
jgi:hypothetical protein